MSGKSDFSNYSSLVTNCCRENTAYICSCGPAVIFDNTQHASLLYTFLLLVNNPSNLSNTPTPNKYPLCLSSPFAILPTIFKHATTRLSYLLPIYYIILGTTPESIHACILSIFVGPYFTLFV